MSQQFDNYRDIPRHKKNYEETNNDLTNDNILLEDNLKDTSLNTIYNNSNKDYTLLSADADKDEYENNDSITAAKLISPSYDGSYAPIDYFKTINATLHRNEWLWG